MESEAVYGVQLVQEYGSGISQQYQVIFITTIFCSHGNSMSLISSDNYGFIVKNRVAGGLTYHTVVYRGRLPGTGYKWHVS